MSGDDDYERLLREVEAATSGGATPPARRQDASPAPRATGAAPASTTASPLRTGVVAGVVCGAGVGTLTFLFSWLPFIDNPVSSGMGAFVGAFLTGAVLSWRRGR